VEPHIGPVLLVHFTITVVVYSFDRVTL